MRADYKLPSEVSSTLSQEAINLLKRIFSIDANRRPTARDILNDPWLQDPELIQIGQRSHSQQPEGYSKQPE
jgi:serine/threonine protein kinase